MEADARRAPDGKVNKATRITHNQDVAITIRVYDYYHFIRIATVVGFHTVLAPLTLLVNKQVYPFQKAILQARSMRALPAKINRGMRELFPAF